MGDNLEVVDKEGSNGAGPWGGLQGSSTDSAAVRQKKLDGDRGDIEDTGGVSPPGVQKDCRDDSGTCGIRDVGISPDGGGD